MWNGKESNFNLFWSYDCVCHFYESSIIVAVVQVEGDETKGSLYHC